MIGNGRAIFGSENDCLPQDGQLHSGQSSGVNDKEGFQLGKCVERRKKLG